MNKSCGMLGMEVGDLILSDGVEGVGVIIMLPDDCKDNQIKFAKVKFPSLKVKYFTIDSLIRARQRFLDATTNR